MFYQQQSQLTKIDVGFCDAEKFATAMTIEVVPKILGLLALHAHAHNEGETLIG